MASTAHLQEIKSYPLSGPDSEPLLSNALKILKPSLPVSIPLYRRLQFGRFFDASCLLTNLPLNNTSISSPTNDSPWLIAFVDRSCRPETEVWICGSWESDSSDVSADKQSAIDNLLTNLVQVTKSLAVPISIHEDTQDARTETTANGDAQGKDHIGLSRKDYGGHAGDPDIMLWGAVHEKTVATMQRLGLLSFRYKRILQPNYMFIWDVDQLPTPKPLPTGLRWGELRPEHFELVRSRTQIPRQDRTLSILANLAIYPKGSDTPISWAFVGLDASLTTLHVEEEWRGKGLAKALTTKLFMERMGSFWEIGERKLAHGYVISGNEESEGMCRSLGGRYDWDVYWLRVDLSVV